MTGLKSWKNIRKQENFLWRPVSNQLSPQQSQEQIKISSPSFDFLTSQVKKTTTNISLNNGEPWWFKSF